MLRIAGLLVTVTALFAYVNHRFIRLPTTIGVMVISLAFSLSLVVATALGFGGLETHAERLLTQVDFNEVLMQGMLSLLLFAGAQHVDLDELRQRQWAIALLATVGLLLSTALVGLGFFVVSRWAGAPLGLPYCLVFGALIAPTDPIAVMGILKSAGAPKALEIKIAGESLFNDGVAVVVFVVLAGVAAGTARPDPGHVALLLLEEAVGGVVYGVAIGYLAYRMLKSIDDYQVEVLITLALVLGGYALAGILHVSGPLAMVVAGLLIGNRGRSFAMSDTTREHLDVFWELMDGILNALLFVMIGLEVVILPFSGALLRAALLAIPLVLVARLVSVAVPISALRPFTDVSPHTVRVLTWGGVRGGISVALALSLPAGPERELLLFVTYAVVVFSILVQGLTLGRVVRACLPAGANPQEA